MKRLFSILLSVAVLAASLPVFASTEPVEGGHKETIYSDDMSAYSETINSSVISYDNNWKPTYSYDNGAIKIQRASDKYKGSLYYNFLGEYASPHMSFGFDLNVSGVEGDADDALLSVSPGTNGGRPKGVEGGTSWCFHGTNAKGLSLRKSDETDASGKAKIKLGDTFLEQEKEYTYTYYVDFKNLTYDITVTDKDNGTVYNAIVAQPLNELFDALYKIELSIFDSTALCRLDNVFINYDDSSSFGFLSGDEIKVADDGTIKLKAVIPTGYTEPKLYINDTFVENIALTSGKTDYLITATLPAGTAFGNNEIKLTASKDGAEISTTLSAKLVKGIKTLKESVPFTSTSPFGFTGVGNGNIAVAEADSTVSGGYKIKINQESAEFTTKTFSNVYSKEGVYEMSFDIMTAAPSKVYLYERFTYDTGGGTGVNFSINSTTSDYHTLTNKTGKIGDQPIIANEWNGVAVRVDYKNATFDVYLNGNRAITGTLTNTDTYPSFKAYRILLGGEDLYFANLELNKVSDYPEIGDVSLFYANETQKYTGTAASSLGLKKITFAASEEITLGTKGAKLLGASGADTGATVTASGSTITATLPENVLPTGDYTLAIASDAKVNGVTLGAEVQKEISLLSSDAIIAPEVGEKIVGTDAKLSVFADGADKVIFAVDDKIVKEFDVSSNSMYTYTFASETIGEKTFDAYIIKDSETKLISRKFTVEPYFVENNYTLNSWTKYDDKGELPQGTLFYEGNIYYSEFAKTAMAGRAVIEGNFTPSTNTHNYYFSFAYANNDTFSTADDIFTTLSDMIGFKEGSNDAYALFNADGTIYDTGKHYSAGQTYRIKMVLDTDGDAYEFYVDGDLIARKEGGAHISKAKFLYNRIRLIVRNSDNTVDSTVSAVFNNVSLYQEFKAPKAQITDNVISESDTSVAFTLDKAYVALDSDDVTVKLDGVAAVNPTVAYNADTKTVTVSGLNLKGVKKLDIEISGEAEITIPYADINSKVYTTKNVGAQGKVAASFYVKNSDGLSVMNAKSAAVGSGKMAFAKYINTAESSEGNVFVADSATRSTVSVGDITFKANATDVIFAPYTSASKLFIWNKNLKPLIDAVELQ